jgi:hypothetical protein
MSYLLSSQIVTPSPLPLYLAPLLYCSLIILADLATVLLYITFRFWSFRHVKRTERIVQHKTASKIKYRPPETKFLDRFSTQPRRDKHLQETWQEKTPMVQSQASCHFQAQEWTSEQKGRRLIMSSVQGHRLRYRLHPRLPKQKWCLHRKSWNSF